MNKYFLKPDGSISLVFENLLGDEFFNPLGYDTKDIKKLPAPIEYCTHKDGKIFAKDGYLDEIKTAAKTTINNIRDKVEQSGFLFNGRLIDSDKDSCLRITITEKAGIATYWTCADNTMIWLEPKDLTLMALALRDHSNRCFEIAHLWKCYVDECADHEEVEAVMAQFNEGAFNAN